MESNKFLSLKRNQSEEPLITYINPEGKRVYGTLRFKVADIYITLCLSKHFEKVVIIKESPVDITLKGGYSTQGYLIKLI